MRDTAMFAPEEDWVHHVGDLSVYRISPVSLVRFLFDRTIGRSGKIFFDIGEKTENCAHRFLNLYSRNKKRNKMDR